MLVAGLKGMSLQQPLISSRVNPFIRAFATIRLLCACSKVLTPPAVLARCTRIVPSAGWLAARAGVHCHGDPYAARFQPAFVCFFLLPNRISTVSPSRHKNALHGRRCTFASYLCPAHFTHEEAGKIDSKIARALPPHVESESAAQVGKDFRAALPSHCNHQAANNNNKKK